MQIKFYLFLYYAYEVTFVFQFEGIKIYFGLLVYQACQTSGPRAACGPISYQMWPSAAFQALISLKNIIKNETYSNLYM